MGWFNKIQLSGLSPAAFFVLAVNHIIGVIGLNMPGYAALFETLAGLNLLLSFLLVIAFHKPVNIGLLLFCMAAFIIGMAAEITGVNTGYPFGTYYYTGMFGPQVLKVPVIIGFNWVLLGYTLGIVANRYSNNKYSKILWAAVCMVLIDLVLERFAIRHHFWVWQNGSPPLQNYISWFFISLLIQLFFRWFIGKGENVNAIRYLVILIVFLVTDLFFAVLC